VIEELQHGEEPKAFQSNGTTEAFGEFEEAILQTLAWANEIPPEILRLTFNSNYSASQAAINEFKAYLNKVRTTFGENFCEPIYQEWLVAEVLAERIKAPRLLDAWRDALLYDVLGAWMSSDWSGNIKPAVDLSKLVKGYTEMVNQGFISRDRATRELTGMKYSKVAKRLKRENEALAEANKPIAELEAAKKPQPPAPPEGSGDEPPDDGEDDTEGNDSDAMAPSPRRSGSLRVVAEART
jgi:capsid protein